MTNQRPFREIGFAWLFLCTAVVALLFVYAFDWDLKGGIAATIPLPEGDELSATYYPGRLPGGVLLLEGFGSDQLALRSAVRELSHQGLHVFTFDFSGHSRSPGTLGFDNAETDRLAYQTMAALDVFQSISGLDRRQILLLGHSLGARVALQTAVLTSDLPAGLILLGAQVNLGTNTQAEFFTGTSDADLEWVQALGVAQPPVPIFLISGTWDDILTPAAAQSLLCALTEPGCQPGVRYGSLSDGNAREWLLLPALLHNYEIISPRVLKAALGWAGEVLNLAVDSNGGFAGARIGLWIIALAGLWGGLLLAGQPQDDHITRIPIQGPTIVSVRRFLWGKLLLWLPALPLAAIVSGVAFVLPLGKPVINLIYVGFIGAYGILLGVLYRLGRMPGIQGKLARNDIQAAVGTRQVVLAVCLTLGVFVFTAAYARSGWFYVFPLNTRLIWLLFFTPPTALGFWIGLREAGWLRRDVPDRKGLLFWHSMIGLVPFFVYAIFMGALGSLSGLTGSLQGLVVLGLVLAYGGAFQRLTGRGWLTAVCQSLLLYWLIVPQGVLF